MGREKEGRGPAAGGIVLQGLKGDRCPWSQELLQLKTLFIPWLFTSNRQVLCHNGTSQATSHSTTANLLTDANTQPSQPISWLIMTNLCITTNKPKQPCKMHKLQPVRLQPGFRAFRLRPHWYKYDLHRLRVALYFKWCYITWMLHYECHNNDIIIDVKTFWHPFLLFSWQKKRVTYTKTCTSWQLVLVQNPYCERLLMEYNANSCLLKPVQGYLDSYSYQCDVASGLETPVLSYRHRSYSDWSKLWAAQLTSKC